MGWPLTAHEYGGAWIYGGTDNIVSLGFVTGLDYADPRLDPQRVLRRVDGILLSRNYYEGGKMITGAKWIATAAGGRFRRSQAMDG